MSKKGFTLIEVVLMVCILASLFLIAVFAFNRGYKIARNAAREQVMKDVKGGLELYFIRNQQFPSSPNNFCGMLTMLTADNYLINPAVDPFTKTNICTSGSDGNKYVGGAMYVYEATPSSGTYLLKLAREGGGYSEF